MHFTQDWIYETVMETFMKTISTSPPRIQIGRWLRSRRVAASLSQHTTPSLSLATGRTDSITKSGEFPFPSDTFSSLRETAD